MEPALKLVTELKLGSGKIGSHGGVKLVCKKKK